MSAIASALPTRQSFTAARLAQPAVLVVLGALVLAAVSLLYPSTPTYDPWAWIVWGRETLELNLTTTGGPSWKPLPMLFTVPFALFGQASPDLWIIVARAGSIISLVLTFLLAGLLCERAFDEAEAPRFGWVAILAGGVAVVGVLFQTGFIRVTMLADSEGLVNATAFGAIYYHLLNRRKAALVLATGAALLRPEVWVFLGLYGVWLWFANPELRRLLIGCAITVPVLWLVPEYIGSGNLFRAAARAQHPNEYSPAFADNPFFQTLKETRPNIPSAIKPAIQLGALFALWAAWRRRFAPLAVLVAALGWITLIAGMTNFGFAGNPRYMMLGTSLLAVIAGFGAGSALATVRNLARRVDPLLVTLVTLVGFAALPTALWVRGIDERVHRLQHLDVVLHQEAQRRDMLPAAISIGGGSKALLACGEVTTERFQVPLVAWYLHTRLSRVGMGVEESGKPGGWTSPPIPGTALQTSSPGNPPNPIAGPPGSRTLGKSGPWTVLQACSTPKQGSVLAGANRSR
ncbi:MAG: hypothetical protein F2799_01855 [Actinobacteria bacterium]|uniref:Unannotated protein n=1 Tax=freshwater metagenome TaxID=449393 RepID=A0A6J7D2U7_9ZZZZ|nr:hypothetical protein [Actinomycetota bacterium]